MLTLRAIVQSRMILCIFDGLFLLGEPVMNLHFHLLDRLIWVSPDLLIYLISRFVRLVFVCARKKIIDFLLSSQFAQGHLQMWNFLCHQPSKIVIFGFVSEVVPILNQHVCQVRLVLVMSSPGELVYSLLLLQFDAQIYFIYDSQLVDDDHPKSDVNKEISALIFGLDVSNPLSEEQAEI